MIFFGKERLVFLRDFIFWVLRDQRWRGDFFEDGKTKMVRNFVFFGDKRTGWGQIEN